MIYFNDQFIKNENSISIHDSGFTTGIGIFDSMLAHDGELIHSKDHYDRIIFDSENIIGIAPHLTYKNFISICHKLLEQNNLKTNHARVRTMITGSTTPKPLMKSTQTSILIHVANATPPNENKIMRVALVTDFPRIAGCKLENSKRLDYSRSYAARRAAEKLGAEDAILINTDGHIACGTTSNIFIKENGKLFTPPLSDGVLAGVTRKNILRKNPTTNQESISLDRLKKADIIYLTNSFFGMKPVKLIN